MIQLDRLVKVCGYETEQHMVTLENMDCLLTQIKEKENLKDLIIFNLCDGTDGGEGGDGFPGISLVRLLQDMGYHFTGCDYDFYFNCTSKI